MFMILGGLLGFLIGLAVGLAQQNGWPSILWHASVAAYVSGVMLRWWGGVWMRSLQQVQHERVALARAKAESAAQTKKP
ncbi:MAG TPA: hypothetical protein VHH73_02100 [Verrucomicrobiae bacterium]|nr:hypothetical protein [Verrucomicrobiae bacterium]